MCATSWYKGSALRLPISNNTADFASSLLEHPAIYTLELSATLGGVTRTCPNTVAVSVDLLDCSSSGSYTNHTAVIAASNKTAVAPSA